MQRQQNKAPEYLPGDIYEKEYGEAEEDGANDDDPVLDPMQVDQTKASTIEKGSASTDITMEDKSVQEETKKRKLPEDSEGSAAMGTMQQMLKMMQAQSEAKDKQIEALTKTIQGLQMQIQELMAAMKEGKQEGDE